MRVDGVDRPWWWTTRPPGLIVGMPTVAAAGSLEILYLHPSTLRLISLTLWLFVAVANGAKVIATRRRLRWEERQY